MKMRGTKKPRVLLWSSLIGMAMIFALFFATREVLWASVLTWICLPIILITSFTALGKKTLPGTVQTRTAAWCSKIFAVQLFYFAWLACAAKIMAPPAETLSPWLLAMLGNTFVYGWHPWGWVALLLILFARAAPHVRPSLGQQLGVKNTMLQESVNFAAHGGLTISVAITGLILWVGVYTLLQKFLPLPALQPATAFSFWLLLGLVIISGTRLWQGVLQRLPQKTSQQIWCWHWGGMMIITAIALVISLIWLGPQHFILTQKLNLEFDFVLNQGQAWGLGMWSVGILMGPTFALLIGHFSQGRSLRSVLLVLFLLPLLIAMICFSGRVLNLFLTATSLVNSAVWLSLAVILCLLGLIYLMKSPLDYAWLAQSPNYCSGKIQRCRGLLARNSGMHAYCLAFFLILGLPAITLLSVIFAFPLFYGVLILFIFRSRG
jgi:hypothetical protein